MHSHDFNIVRSDLPSVSKCIKLKLCWQKMREFKRKREIVCTCTHQQVNERWWKILKVLRQITKSLISTGFSCESRVVQKYCCSIRDALDFHFFPPSYSHYIRLRANENPLKIVIFLFLPFEGKFSSNKTFHREGALRPQAKPSA